MDYVFVDHPGSPTRGRDIYGGERQDIQFRCALLCKAALERFTTGLASEVQANGIAVNVVSPGLVDTPGVAVHGLINAQSKDRVQPIEYIAEAVYQLAKADPATMTGRVDYAEPLLKELGLEPSALI